MLLLIDLRHCCFAHHINDHSGSELAGKERNALAPRRHSPGLSGRGPVESTLHQGRSLLEGVFLTGLLPKRLTGKVGGYSRIF